MFLSKLQTKNLLPFWQTIALFCCITLSSFALPGKDTSTAPYVLGRAKAKSILYEDPTNNQLAQGQEETSLRKAFSPSVAYNIEILCQWNSYFRVKILGGENTYLLRAEDVLFLGRNLIELNNVAWRAVIREELKGLVANDPLVKKIETCLPKDNPVQPPDPKEIVSAADHSKEVQNPPPTKGTTRGKYRNSTLKPFTYSLHQVKEGESLSTLAKKYHINLSDILAINELDSRSLKKGQMVRIPKANTQLPPKYHKVKPGETLWRIAFNHSTSVEALKSANKLHSNTIFSGQKLEIPQD